MYLYCVCDLTFNFLNRLSFLYAQMLVSLKHWLLVFHQVPQSPVLLDAHLPAFSNGS